MTAMLLFLGGYQREEEFIDKSSVNMVHTRVLNSDIPESIETINEKDLKEKCPSLYCVNNKMIQQSNNFVCKYVTPTFDSDKFKLTLKVADSGAGSSANTEYLGGGKAIITFDPELCKNGVLQTGQMAKILHEFVHVELARQMFLKGYDFNDINDIKKFYPTLSEYITKIAATQVQSEIHHNIMLEYENIIDKMAQSLFEMFNGKANGLTVDHFKLAAANGLFGVMEHTASTNPNFNKLYGEFISKYEAKGV